nr:hypothetical protein [Tanacetum cinerariifolium]
PVQTTIAKKMDNRQAKHKDANSNKVSSNFNSGSKYVWLVQVVRKFVTSNPFDVLNMVDKDIGVAPGDLVKSKGNNVNLGNSKDINLDNKDNDSENAVEVDDNETASFMALKVLTPYDDDEECKDLTEAQLAFCDA